MTKLDRVLARIRKLPPDQQEAVAGEIDRLLNDVEQGASSVLTDEQWAEIETALANASEPVSSHEDVFARLRAAE